MRLHANAPLGRPTSRSDACGSSSCRTASAARSPGSSSSSTTDGRDGGPRNRGHLEGLRLGDTFDRRGQAGHPAFPVGRVMVETPERRLECPAPQQGVIGLSRLEEHLPVVGHEVIDRGE